MCIWTLEWITIILEKTPLSTTAPSSLAGFLSLLSYPAELGGDSSVYSIRQGELSGLRLIRLISGQIKKIIQESYCQFSYTISKIIFCFYIQSAFSMPLDILGLINFS